MALTTHHREKRWMPVEGRTAKVYHSYEKEQILEQMSTKRSYRLFVGVDIAYQTFTSASLLPGAKPTRELKPFEQNSTRL